MEGLSIHSFTFRSVNKEISRIINSNRLNMEEDKRSDSHQSSDEEVPPTTTNGPIQDITDEEAKRTSALLHNIKSKGTNSVGILVLTLLLFSITMLMHPRISILKALKCLRVMD
jgi:hypothetical protein